MKRIGFLWSKFVSDENMTLAYNQALKKIKHPKKRIFYVENQEALKLEIKNSLENNTWTHSPYVQKVINDKGKQRTISIAKFYPDRIIHNMINNILEEVFVPKFISDTYQCIKGRGTHKAIAKAVKYVKLHSDEYCLKLDLAKYYPSIPNDLLLQKLERKIKDKKFLEVLEVLINSTTGLPIGNHTSQILGNIFLMDFDHKVKEQSKFYIRYADDIIIFGSKKELQIILRNVKEYLSENKIKLNNKSKLYPLKNTYLLFLGFRIYSKFIRPGKHMIYRILRNKSRFNYETRAAYFGWICISDAKILLLKLFIDNLGTLNKYLKRINYENFKYRIKTANN